MSDKKVTTKRNRRKSEQSVEIVPLLPDAIPSPADRHRSRMASMKTKRPKPDASNKARFLEAIRMGELPVDVCDDRAMPPYSAFMRECQNDEQFAADYEEAVSVMADMAIQDAKRFARDCASTGNIDSMRVADAYVKAVNSAVEKLSPRTHGALIKHAGSDAGPLQVAVINYAASQNATKS